MNEIYQTLAQPWPWFIAGPLISLVMFGLIYFGESFGVSSNFRTLCSMAGAGKNCGFFDFNWKTQVWNLVFVLGVGIGGYIAHEFLSPGTAIGIDSSTVEELKVFGLQTSTNTMVPVSIFSWDGLLTIKGFIMIVLGGFLVGFGTRYAGGCTSGHAISGLSDLQLPSLIAVLGFFIGGLSVTYFVLPYLLNL